MKYIINYQDKEVEIERLPNGKFKIPPLGQFTKQGLGSTWLKDGMIPFEVGKTGYSYNADRNGTTFHGQQGERIKQTAEKKGQQTVDSNPRGRFPANLLVSDDVLNDGRVQNSNSWRKEKGSKTAFFGNADKEIGQGGYPDSGSFSRYFDLDKWWDSKLKELKL